MRAAVFYGVGKPLVVEEVLLEGPGPGEVKVRLGATGICHSDIHFFDGDVPARSLPGIAGHECAGYVEEIAVLGNHSFSPLSAGRLAASGLTLSTSDRRKRSLSVPYPRGG